MRWAIGPGRGHAGDFPPVPLGSPAVAEGRGTFGSCARDTSKSQSNRYRGEFMATATSTAQPSRDDFAKMLEESFAQGSPQEGAVVKGTVVGIEKDLAVIDVGAKTEGRVALREFAGPGRAAEIKVGDTVEVYLERVENEIGRASCRERAQQSVGGTTRE